MGIDACISFHAPSCMGDDINDLAYDLAIRCQMDDHPCITADRYSDDTWKVQVWDRYFGKGYERGSWPHIRSVLDVLLDWQDRGLIGSVFYGGDNSDYPSVFTRDDMGELDEHFRRGEWGYRQRDMLSTDFQERPLDSYGKPMRVCGGGPNVTIFRSQATGEEVRREHQSLTA